MANDRVTQELPEFMHFATELIQYIEKFTTQKIRYKSDDHLAYMALSFVSKQLEHLKSIRLLVEAGHGRDAALISRSMSEGLSYLLWAASEPSKRPLRWRKFINIEIFRSMIDRETRGEVIAPEIRANVLSTLSAMGNEFYREDAKKALQKGNKLPDDPYIYNWYDPLKIKTIFSAVEGLSLYKGPYKKTSQWIHWSPLGLSLAIEKSASLSTYSGNSPEDSIGALAAGFQALYESFKLLNDHLKLGHDKFIDDIRNSYLNRFQSNPLHP